MKTLKLIIIALLLGTTGLSKAHAYDFSLDCNSGQTLYFNIIDRTNHYVEVTFPGIGYLDPWTDYSKPEGDILLPLNVTYNNDTYSLVQIGERAFFECKDISSISIPNSIISIEREAFGGCVGITSINIPSSVSYIGGHVFEGTGWYNNQSEDILYLDGWCLGFKGNEPIGHVEILDGTKHIAGKAFEFCDSLRSITIASSVTSIGESAFRMSGLITISIPNSVVHIGNYAFSTCSDLVSVAISNSITSIGDFTFWECVNLNSIEIPNSVSSIGKAAFTKCSSLTTIVIPSSVTTISQNPFYDCEKLETIIVDDNNTVYDSRNNCNAIIETESNEMITGCKNTIIPNSVTSIGFSAFRGCSGLASINIPNSIISIGESAFCKCGTMTSVTLPNSVTSIGKDAFFRCDSLNTVICLNTEPPTLGAWAFGVLTGDYYAELIVPCGHEEAYKESNWNYYFKSIEEDCNMYSIIAMDADGGSIGLSQSQARLGEEVMITPNPNQDFVLLSVAVCNADDETQLVPVWDNKFTMPNFDVIVKPHFSHTSVDEIGTIPVSIYPNPVKNKVTIETENIKHISISNIMGQVINDVAAEGDSFEYDFGGYEAGVYLIRIETSSGTVSKRIVVTK